VLISNGTGIAPCLGMIAHDKKKTDVHWYSGVRQETEITKYYQNFAYEMIHKQYLTQFVLSYSREANHHYVIDLIQIDADFFAQLLKNDGVIMICGALAMQFDVEKVLDTICISKNNTNLLEYKAKGQILTDCY